MVSRSSRSRDRLLAAAAGEFAARGFDGAKVDRIAARARVNKAMLYYHFANKAALYRAILLDMFGTIRAVVEDVRRAGGSPETQLRAFIEAVHATVQAHPNFPPMWLREMADAGRHLDDAVVREMSGIVGALGGILDAGRETGAFGPAHPLIVQFGLVGPLLLFAATAPIRARYRDRTPHGLADVPQDALVAYVQAMTLAGLTASAGQPARRRRA